MARTALLFGAYRCNPFLARKAPPPNIALIPIAVAPNDSLPPRFIAWLAPKAERFLDWMTTARRSPIATRKESRTPAKPAALVAKFGPVCGYTSAEATEEIVGGDNLKRDIQHQEQYGRRNDLFEELAPPRHHSRFEPRHREACKGDRRYDDEEEEDDETRNEHKCEREQHKCQNNKKDNAHKADKPRVSALEYPRVSIFAAS